MMTGINKLQSTKSRLNQYSVVEICPLCRLGSEDLPHVLLRYRAVAGVSDLSLNDIRELVTSLVSSSGTEVINKSHAQLY